MRNGFKKFVSLILTICLLLSSAAVLADEEITESVSEVIEEAAVSQESVPEEYAAGEPDQKTAAPEPDTAETAEEVKADNPAEEETTGESGEEKPATEEKEQDDKEIQAETEEPATEETEQESAEVKSEEGQPSQEPAIEVLSEEQGEELISEEVFPIDTAKPVSENAEFEKGYVEILRETAVYADQDDEIKTAVLESGLAEAINRINPGKDDDQVLIIFEIGNEKITGYVSSKDVRPCTAEETEKWLQGNGTVKGNLIEAETEAVEITEEELKQEGAISEETAQTQTPAEGDEASEAIEYVEIEEVQAVLIDETTETAVEEITEENIETGEVVEDGKGDAAQDETPIGEEDTENILEAAYAVAGDVELTIGKTSNIPIPKGINAKAYASFVMDTAGLLTLTFKSVSTAHGNVMVSIRDSKDSPLWTTMWASNVGTVNYSAFVEADSYVVIIEKTDSDDDAAYVLSAEPIVSKTGEAGVRNNTMNNAATITVNGSEITGIKTQQDIITGRDDYYKFTLSTPGYVMLQYTNLSMSNLRFLLRGDDTSTENEIASLSQIVVGTFDRNEMQTISVNRNGWLDAGVYYISVQNATVDGRYRISVSMSPITITEKEKNNTFQQAYDSDNMLPLNDTVVTALLGASDTVDCYDFYLAAPTRVSVKLKIQFSDVVAAIYSRNGNMVAGSSFGATGTTGSDGNPYELELNKFRLEEGYYYVRISRSGTSTGKYSISAHTTITASILTADAPNGGEKVTLTAKATGYGSNWKCFLYIYEDTLSGPQVVDSYEYTNIYDIVQNYYPRASGNYLVQFVVTDGVNSDDRWASFSSTVRDFNITLITASIDSQGNVHCIANYTGNSTLRGSIASWYLGGVLVDSVQLGGGNEWTFKAPVSGRYSIQFAGTMTGTTWKDGWTAIDVAAPSPTLPIIVSALNVSSTNTGVINCSAETQEGYQPQTAMFILYKDGKEIARTEHDTAKAASFKVDTSGNYTVQCIASDGATMADKWATVIVNISASSVLKVSTLTATADDDGKGIISMAGTTQGGKDVISAIFYLYSNNQLIGSYGATNGFATATVYQSGTYAVQYVVYDGNTYADKWTTVSVSLNAQSQPVNITNVAASADTSGAITIQTQYTSSRALQQLNYYVYDAAGKIVNVKYSTAEKQAKLYVTKSGTYTIQVVAFDGEVWDDYWTTVTVTLSGASTTPLSVTSLTVNGITPNSFYMSAVTNDSRQLVSSMFYIFEGTKLVRSIAGPNKEATCSDIPVGNYSVQYVAYDGVTWADKWATASAGASTLAINSMTVTKSSNYYICSATVTNNMDIRNAWYVLYDASDNQIAAWYWDGTGSYLDHIFLIDSSLTVAKVQYTVSDGVKWVDAWDTP